MFGVRRNEREGERLERERRPVVDVQQCASPAVGWLPCLGVLPLVNMRRGEGTYSEGVKKGEGAKVRN